MFIVLLLMVEVWGEYPGFIVCTRGVLCTRMYESTGPSASANRRVLGDWTMRRRQPRSSRLGRRRADRPSGSEIALSLVEMAIGGQAAGVIEANLSHVACEGHSAGGSAERW